MGVFGRLKMGLTLTKDSVLVLRNNPRLAIFPLVSGIAGLLFLVVFLGITFGLMAVDPEGGVLVGLFLVYLGLTFISTFFTAALVHQTRAVLVGEDPSLGAGVQAAWDERNLIMIWSLISATIGVIITAIENSDSRVARVFATLFSAAWTLLTFFIIPTIVFEKTTTKGMFTTSASTFKQTWGETPISLIGVQLISMFVVVPMLILGYLLAAIHPVVGIGTVLVGVLLGFLVGQSLQGIIKTTLYLYAKEGTRPAEFDNVDFDRLSESGPDHESPDQRAPAGRV